jgi:hypothetical protein
VGIIPSESKDYMVPYNNNKKNTLHLSDFEMVTLVSGLTLNKKI